MRHKKGGRIKKSREDDNRENEEEGRRFSQSIWFSEPEATCSHWTRGHHRDGDVAGGARRDDLRNHQKRCFQRRPRGERDSLAS